MSAAVHRVGRGRGECTVQGHAARPRGRTAGRITDPCIEEVHMAERRRGGDERATRRDGPGGAGAGPMQATGPGEQRASGQQSGSKRPAVKTGAAKRAPKKGEKG